jgi:hypothetical protein
MSAPTVEEHAVGNQFCERCWLITKQRIGRGDHPALAAMSLYDNTYATHHGRRPSGER